MNMTELNELHHLAAKLRSFGKFSQEQATECDNKKDDRTEWSRLTPYYKGKQDAYIRAAQAVENIIEQLNNK
jgi:hypothetical protein